MKTSAKQRVLLCTIAIMCVLSGCVVERLLTFKRQMKTPATAIDFSYPGVLRFNVPVLKMEDIALLTGLEPSKVLGETATYYFIRPDAPNYSLTYTVVFMNDRLSVIDYPDEFDRLISATFATQLLSVLGDADMPRAKVWSITNNTNTRMESPSMQAIKTALGPPSFVTTTPNNITLHYHYQHPSIGGHQRVNISLTYNENNSEKNLSEVFIELPGRQWRFEI